MNKKLLALLLIAVMLFAVGCGNNVDTEETIQPSQSPETENNTEIPDGTIPGVVSLEKPLINPLDEMEDAEQETTENYGFIDNTDSSNSGGNGQSSTGNSNTGNGSSQGGSNNNGNANGNSNTGNGSSQGNNNKNGNTNGNSNTGSGSSQGSSNTGSGSSQGSSNSNGNANGSTNAEKPTQSGDNTAADPQPTESKPTEPSSEIEYVSYEEYNNMPPAEQVAYYNQFPSMEAFVKWYNEAKAAYDAEHVSIDLGDGNIDLRDIVNP